MKVIRNLMRAVVAEIALGLGPDLGGARLEGIGSVDDRLQLPTCFGQSVLEGARLAND